MTLHLYPYLRPWVGSFIDQNFLAAIVTIAAVFLVLLITFKLGVSFLSKSVKDSPLGSLDRGLGILFGAFTGFLFLIAVYLGLQCSLSATSYPESLNKSKIWPFVAIGSTYVERLIPVKLPKLDEGPTAAENRAARERLMQKFSHAPSQKSQKPSVGYPAKDRAALDTIFSTTE